MAEARWTPAELQAWQRVIRDLLIDGAALFLIVYASINAVAFGLTIVAAMFSTALALWGVPTVLRLKREEANG